MKPSVLLCFAFLLHAAAFAQQPADPQPNVFDSTHSPTLEETTKFILDTANDPKVARQEFRPDGGNQQYVETYGVSSPAACTLEWNMLQLVDKALTYRDTYIVHLSDLDLHRITVQQGFSGFNGSDEYSGFYANLPGENKLFSVAMWMRSGQPDVTHYANKSAPSLGGNKKMTASLEAIKDTGISQAKTVSSCAPSESACSITHPKPANVSVFLSDGETAYRLSHALRHLASLCGAKSASPF
jgi:hypothetical protein